jgi:hypothetical protein
MSAATGIDFYVYLQDVSTQLRYNTNHQIHQLTPAAWHAARITKLKPAS